MTLPLSSDAPLSLGAVIGGINRAARFGIIVKGGAAIEQIGRAQAVVFDKTGTLTFGSPSVEAVLPHGDAARADLLRLAGAAEQLSSHPLAQALTKAALEARADEATALPVAAALRELAGGGVEANVEGHAVVVGSPAFILETTGQSVPESALERDYLASYIAVDGRFAGAVRFTDALRPGVPELVQRLKRLGVQRTVMLTGDRAAHAQVISEAAGLDAFEAGLLPEDKVASVRRLQAQFAPLVMVGDGDRKSVV